MGFKISWIGFNGKDKVTTLEIIGLKDTREPDEINESPFHPHRTRISRPARAPLAMLIAVVAVTLLSSSRLVIAQSSLERQAQCELSAIRDTRSAIAIQSIRSACNWLALNGDSLLNERSMAYHVCLVRELSGVQADQAALAILSACRTANPQ